MSIKYESPVFHKKYEPALFYKIHVPAEPSRPLILSAPHAGRDFPIGFVEASPLSKAQLLETTDFHTDKLVTAWPNSAYIYAQFARSLVDLNRAPNLLDPCVIEGLAGNPNPYVQAGYGVIPRFTGKNRLIRNGKISINQAQALIQRYHTPYHQALDSLINDCVQAFGLAILFDIHTAPENSLQGHDIVLGTHHGQSISPTLFKPIKAAFEHCFGSVGVNAPYAGGYITHHYGQPSKAVHVLQIEISRALVENENRTRNQGFFNSWRVVIKEITTWLDLTLQAGLAAE